MSSPQASGLAYSPRFLEHDTGPGHPERPARLSAVVRRLRAARVWDRMQVWEPSEAADEILELVHTATHVQFVRNQVLRGGGAIDLDTRTSPGSLAAALRAAGALVEAADRVSSGALSNAYCLVRPPGHHATPTQAMGFCLFNNVAIAAAWLLSNQRVERLAILDFDVHHGNGTQEAFYNRAEVLYVSTHQYPFYPGTGHWSETGMGPGRGSTVNIPLPAGAGDAVYAAVRDQIIEPAVLRFQPDLILVSLGFDAYWDDPLAGLRLSIGGGYTSLLRSARLLADQLSQGRLIVALEGGYKLDAVAHGSEALCCTLLAEDPPPDPLGPAPSQLAPESAGEFVSAIRLLHHL